MATGGSARIDTVGIIIWKRSGFSATALRASFSQDTITSPIFFLAKVLVAAGAL
jgi:hypothetical protein